MQYWDGTTWVMIPVGKNNTVLRNCDGIPKWVSDHCGNFVIGDTGPAGGFVFHINDATGLHGLEAAPVDQAISKGGCNDNNYVGQGTAIGTGLTNTNNILASCSDTDIAARVVQAYSLNGFSDWYLPSMDELNAMYYRIGKAAVAPLTNIGAFADSWYLSSSDTGMYLWAEHFGLGYISSYNFPKTQFGNVRAIRSF